MSRLIFETYFDHDYTLKKLSTEAYIRDPRFVVLGAGIKWGKDYAARWYDARELQWILANEDWTDTAVLCHHTQFDGLILSHHFKVCPKLWLDTLSMARLCLGNHLSVALDSVRAFYGLAAKRTPYEQFKGKHWAQLDEETRGRLAAGCCDEVESIWTIFHRLAKDFPAEEYGVVDLTMRMFTQPVLGADIELLAALWSREEADKKAQQQALNVSAEELGSNATFAALLEAEGVEIASKDGKAGPLPCFAKTDAFMQELLDDDNPRVRGLVRARLGIKSTLLQTRAETIGHMGQRGRLCVYLRYCGAHTTRWSGGDASNFQNLKRGSDLRKAIVAPAGWLLATVDLAQIECRILNHIAGQTDVIERFRRGDDPYLAIAAAIYGRAISKAEGAERGVGKQAELSCGYGSGWRRFQGTARLGLYGPAVSLSDAEAQRAVRLYRETHRAVVSLWAAADAALAVLADRLDRDFLPTLRMRDGKMYLPNGTWINYQTLKWVRDEAGAGWQMKTRMGWTRMYGAKLVENCVQALARLLLSQAGLRIARAGFRPVLSSHDEWSFLVPKDGESGKALDFIMQEMTRPPSWLPGLPVDCEAFIGDRYEK